MSTNKDNVGKQFTLPVLDVITIKDRKSYIVQYGEPRCRIPLFEWQYDMETPIEICCRLIAVNDFGAFQSAEQKANLNVAKAQAPLCTIIRTADELASTLLED